MPGLAGGRLYARRIVEIPRKRPRFDPEACIQRSVNKTLLTIYLGGMRNLQRRKSQYMEIASGRGPNCTCSHTPPEDASEATPTEPCSPTPGLAFPADQPSAQVVTTEYVRQFLDILKSLSTQQGPPPPPTKLSSESGEPKPRASRLEFKTVNEVYVSNAARIQAY
jgi:hypothetical protein